MMTTTSAPEWQILTPPPGRVPRPCGESAFLEDGRVGDAPDSANESQGCRLRHGSTSRYRCRLPALCGYFHPSKHLSTRSPTCWAEASACVPSPGPLAVAGSSGHGGLHALFRSRSAPSPPESPAVGSALPSPEQGRGYRTPCIGVRHVREDWQPPIEVVGDRPCAGTRVRRPEPFRARRPRLVQRESLPGPA